MPSGDRLSCRCVGGFSTPKSSRSAIQSLAANRPRTACRPCRAPHKAGQLVATTRLTDAVGAPSMRRVLDVCCAVHDEPAFTVRLVLLRTIVSG